jgi:hypothetical protein
VTVRDRPYLDEHSDLVTAGLLAEDVVFAVAAHREGRPLAEGDRQALTAAQTLLRFIAAPEIRHTGRSGISHLSGSTGILEALRAAEIQAPEHDVRHFLESLLIAIDEALDGEVSPELHERLAALQRLFAGLGDIALARSNALAGATGDRLLWPSATKISASL